MSVYEPVAWWVGGEVAAPRLSATHSIPSSRRCLFLSLLVLPSLSPPIKPEGGGQHGWDRIGKTGQARIGHHCHFPLSFPPYTFIEIGCGHVELCRG